MKKLIKKLCLILSLIFVLFTFSSCFIDTENSNSNNNQEEIEQIDFSNLTYTAIGDSITFGCSSSHPTQYENGGYPKLVGNLLSFKSVQNCGIPGDRVDEMISRVDKMHVDADIVSVMAGTNDCFQNVPIGNIDDTGIDTFYGRVKVLVNLLIKRYPTSFIFFITPYKSTRSSLLLDYSLVVKNVCSLYGIPVLDLYTNGQFELEMYNEDSDGIHPSQEFFENYTAPQIAQFIKDNYTDTPNYTIPKQIDFSNLTINCLGDSLTAGLVSNGSVMEKPYPTLLGEILGAKQVNNYGLGGRFLSLDYQDTMCNMYSSMADADIVMVMGGTNDLLSFGWAKGVLGTPADTDKSTIYGALDVLCKGLIEKYPNSFIFFMTPFALADYYDYVYYNNSGFLMEELCNAIKTVCSRYGIKVFDVYNDCSFKTQANIDLSSGVGDGIHPSQEFINSFTPMLAQFIKDNY